jgi:hypothetical protein
LWIERLQCDLVEVSWLFEFDLNVASSGGQLS